MTSARISRYETPIANRPPIVHVLDEIAAAGISEARLVTRAQLRNRLIELLGDRRPAGTRISYVEVGDAEDAQGVILREAATTLGAQPVTLHPADSLGRGRLMTICDRGAGVG